MKHCTFVYFVLQQAKVHQSQRNTPLVPDLQRHTTETTVEDRQLAAAILRKYVGEVEDLGPATIQQFANFTTMFDDSFFLFAAHRCLWREA